MTKSGEENYPKPIGGWLLIYVLTLLVSAALYGMGTINVFGQFMSEFKEWNSMLIIINIGTIVKLFTSALIFYLLITKANVTPKIIIGYELFCILIRLISLSDVIFRYHVMPNSYYVSMFFGLVSVVWILYFLKSKRIKETFVN
ncbi:hypothetical protein ASG89_07520 [Paenibacillus sp. Soil766]|uniref:DUF2569 family protein n=1 Tax=Paenibacillus sp. Soil766 TaxID=1736404 RepID=UPI0007110733|nr:DUF2569 family protein [Paenibacillus sp. Soil766]KRE93338.1 hypothetical protein ASG89_07520 [Paenibacillus sp. Soil766]